MLNRRNFLRGAAAGIAALSVGGIAQARPNGHDTTVVEHSSGSFEKVDDTTWYEYKAGASTPAFKFSKTHEDDWSIYLNDSSRNVQIQLDMHRMWISYGENSSAKRDLYKINNADNRTNGRSATYVTFGQGTFKKSGNDWYELDSNGTHRYTFRETGRDMWSIYARDDSRNMDMQIDLHRDKIRLAWPGHSMQDQYNVTSSR